eukprot:5732154-Pleurochrysis_carterae.AAC.1
MKATDEKSAHTLDIVRKEDASSPDEKEHLGDRVDGVLLQSSDECRERLVQDRKGVSLDHTEKARLLEDLHVDQPRQEANH